MKLLSKVKKNVKFQLQYRQLRHKFFDDLRRYNALADPKDKAQQLFLYPCLFDATKQTEIEPTYYYQDAWAFERIIRENPISHVDIGSSHRFVSFLSKCTDLTMVDIRPLSLPMNSINFREGDILNLPFADGEINSLSSICVIEHIGLGRYGDSLDPRGTEKAAREIDRVLNKEANFYFTVPVEKENRTYFNAHRSFNEKYLLNELFPNYTLLNSQYIYGNEFGSILKEESFGIGCYHLLKKNKRSWV